MRYLLALGVLALGGISVAACAATETSKSVSASCDTQIRDVHFVGEKLRPGTMFKATIEKNSCASGAAPTHVRIVSNGRVIGEAAIPPTLPATIAIPVPPNTELSGISLGMAGAGGLSQLVPLGPLSKNTAAPNAISVGNDIRPQTQIFHLNAAALSPR